MKWNKSRLLIIAMLMLTFFIAGEAQAQSEAIKTAVRLVEGFGAERARIVGKVDKSPEGKKLNTQSERLLKNTVGDLKTLRWTEPPSKKRFRRIRSLVTGYMVTIIKDTRTHAKKRPALKRRFMAAADSLAELKTRSIKELEKTASMEMTPKERKKVVPIIDRSPNDPEPEGIWNR